MSAWRSIGYGAYGDTSKISDRDKKRIVGFVVNTPNLTDKILHDYSVKLGITPDDAEEVIYDYLRKTVRGEPPFAPPLPPPVCQVCGKRHPHFTHGSATYLRGAGRPSKAKPDQPYKLHMTPEEIEGMVYGPMFEKICKERGIPIAQKWEHPPTTPLWGAPPLEGLGQAIPVPTAKQKQIAKLMMYAAVGFFVWMALGAPGIPGPATA